VGTPEPFTRSRRRRSVCKLRTSVVPWLVLPWHACPAAHRLHVFRPRISPLSASNLDPIQATSLDAASVSYSCPRVNLERRSGGKTDADLQNDATGTFGTPRRALKMPRVGCRPEGTAAPQNDAFAPNRMSEIRTALRRYCH
jgi:hypothetical protein